MIKFDWKYISYFIILVLFGILHRVYYKYIFACKEYIEQFTQCNADSCDCAVPNYTDAQNNNKKATCVAKRNTVKELQNLKDIIDASVATRNQATSSKAATAEMKNELVPGKLVDGNILDIDTNEIEEDNPEQNKKCSYKRWIKETIVDEDRDLLVSTIPKLEAKINFELAKLITMKNELLKVISDNITMLKDGLDDQFQGKCYSQCASLEGSGCDVFCQDNSDLTLELETLRNKEYVDQRMIELEHSLCDYVKQYYYVVDLGVGQKEYTEQLKNIYTDASISEATQKRGFATVYLTENIPSRG